MNWGEVVQAAVPTGKAMAWVGGAVVTSFLAGVGWVSQTHQISVAVDAVPRIEVTLAEHSDRIEELEEMSNQAYAEREKIICLVTLTATGEELTPLQVVERCG